MIASLDSRTAPFERLASHYQRFLEALKTRGFDGETAPDYAHRTVLATDNSIYQRLPQAAVFPRHAEDLECLAKLAAEAPYREVVLTPRGGGTGTNGQSLTDGIVVDISRHMNQVLDIDVKPSGTRSSGSREGSVECRLKALRAVFCPRALDLQSSDHRRHDFDRCQRSG